MFDLCPTLAIFRYTGTAAHILVIRGRDINQRILKDHKPLQAREKLDQFTLGPLAVTIRDEYADQGPSDSERETSPSGQG